MGKCALNLCVIALALSFSSAEAAPGSSKKGAYLSLLGGIAFPTTASGTFTFGVSAIYRNSPRLGIGAFLQTWGASVSAVTDSGSASASTSSLSWGGEVNYFLNGGVRLGARTGLMSTDSEFSGDDGGASVSFSDAASTFFVMPLFGYDHMFGGMFSVGAEISYSIGLSTQAVNMFTFMISPKIWF